MKHSLTATLLRGGLKYAIAALALHEPRHSVVSSEPVRFGASTIERRVRVVRTLEPYPVSALAAGGWTAAVQAQLKASNCVEFRTA